MSNNIPRHVGVDTREIHYSVDRQQASRGFSGSTAQSRRMAPSNKIRLYVRRLRDEIDDKHEHKRKLAESFGELKDSDGREKF